MMKSKTKFELLDTNALIAFVEEHMYKLIKTCYEDDILIETYLFTFRF